MNQVGGYAFPLEMSRSLRLSIFSPCSKAHMHALTNSRRIPVLTNARHLHNQTRRRKTAAVCLRSHAAFIYAWAAFYMLLVGQDTSGTRLLSLSPADACTALNIHPSGLAAACALARDVQHVCVRCAYAHSCAFSCRTNAGR